MERNNFHLASIIIFVPSSSNWRHAHCAVVLCHWFCEPLDSNRSAFVLGELLKPRLSHCDRVLVVVYWGSMLSWFRAQILLISTVDFSCFSFESKVKIWRVRRPNLGHACGTRLGFRTKVGWAWYDAFIVRTARIWTDTWSQTAIFRSLCCTQSGNARYWTNLDGIDPVRAGGLRQSWHEVGMERVCLWVWVWVLVCSVQLCGHLHSF